MNEWSMKRNEPKKLNENHAGAGGRNADPPAFGLLRW